MKRYSNTNKAYHNASKNTYKSILNYLYDKNPKECTITELKEKHLIKDVTDRNHLNNLVNEELINLRIARDPTDIANQYIITKNYSITPKGIKTVESDKKYETPKNNSAAA